MATVNLEKSNTPKPTEDELRVQNTESAYTEDEVLAEEPDDIEDAEEEEAEPSEEDKEVAELASEANAEAPAAQEVVPDRKPAKPLTKEESKIVALKKQNQKLAEDYRAMQSRLAELESAQKHGDLKKQYVEQGMDEEYAAKLADKDIAAQKQNERLELLEFRTDNDYILRRYPDARGDIARIMANVKATGMSVEQVCRGLYGLEPVRETRARLAATGELEETDGADTTVSDAQRAAEAPKAKTALTKADINRKREYERMWRNGERMTTEEYLEKKATYGW